MNDLSERALDWHFFSDIFATTISGECVVLVLLDLTAAFHTVDQEILISCMEVGSALEAEHRSGTIQRWTFLC